MKTESLTVGDKAVLARLVSPKAWAVAGFRPRRNLTRCTGYARPASLLTASRRSAWSAWMVHWTRKAGMTASEPRFFAVWAQAHTIQSSKEPGYRLGSFANRSNSCGMVWIVIAAAQLSLTV